MKQNREKKLKKNSRVSFFESKNRHNKNNRQKKTRSRSFFLFFATKSKKNQISLTQQKKSIHSSDRRDAEIKK